MYIQTRSSKEIGKGGKGVAGMAASDCLVDASSTNTNGTYLILTRCPICGVQLIEDLDGYVSQKPVIDHIANHEPEDLDLEPWPE